MECRNCGTEIDESALSKDELLKIKKLCPATFTYHKIFKKTKQPEKQNIWKYLKKSNEVEDKYFYTKEKYSLKKNTGVIVPK